MSVLTHYLKWRIGMSVAETQTTAAERDALARHASGRGLLVEIGVWHGVTTRRLRHAMSPSGLLYAVDPFPIGRLGFSAQQHTSHCEVAREPNGRVEWLCMTAVDAARKIADDVAGKIEFIFIDGDHSYDGLRSDWEHWSPLVAAGGVRAARQSFYTPSIYR